MMKIEKDGHLFAILHRKEEWVGGLDFLTPDESFCQVGTWWYQTGKSLQAHKHVENVRPNNLTQECVIVMSGSVRVDLYDKNDQKFQDIIINEGDLIVLLNGGHGYQILEENTKVIECKNGPFISVEKDKVSI